MCGFELLGRSKHVECGPDSEAREPRIGQREPSTHAILEAASAICEGDALLGTNDIVVVTISRHVRG